LQDGKRGPLLGLHQPLFRLVPDRAQL